ncbi:MAG TPA: hypothetical protein VHW23_07355 [Kofleriaceae bacterium]|jgi:hypothetical protein|nr:hypothetical protein [Kofleriaceae bacterium]
MKKSRLTKQLTISRETLRVLQRTEISAVRGGDLPLGAGGSQADPNGQYNTCGSCNTNNCGTKLKF